MIKSILRESNPWGYISKVFAVSGLVAFFVYVVFFTNADLFLNSDFLSFYSGAKIVANGQGASLYDFSKQLSIEREIKLSYRSQIRIYPIPRLLNALPFRNLPFVAILFVPLTVFSGLTAFRIFGIFNVFLLVLFIKDFEGEKRKKLSWVSKVFISLTFLPVLTSVARGQITIFALWLFYLLYKSLRGNEGFWAGVYASLLLIKIQYIFSLPFVFILTKNRCEFIKGYLVTTGFLLTASFLVSGTGLFQYPNFLSLTEQAGYGSIPSEILTIFSVIRKLTNSGVLAGAFNLLMYIVILLLFWAKRRSLTLTSAIGITVLTTLLFGIHMTDNEVILLLIPILFIFESHFKTFAGKIFLIISFLAPILRFTPFAFYEFVFLALLLVVLFLNETNKSFGSIK